MSSYNFLNPDDANAFKVKAKAKGYGDTDIALYIRNRQKEQIEQETQMQKYESAGLDLAKKKYEYAQMTGLIPEPKKELSVTERKTIGAAQSGLSSLDAIQRILDKDPTKEGYEGKGRLLSQITPELLRSSEGKQLQNEISNLSDAIGRMRSGGAINAEEAKRFKSFLPRLGDDDATIRTKLERVREEITTVLGNDQQPAGMLGQEQTMGMGVQDLVGEQERIPQSPALNLAGEIAKPGDVAYNDKTGSLYVYGKDLEPDKSNVWKTSKDKSTVENGLLKFLADTEALPIAFSVAGGLLGGGTALSIVTGAGGASLGKVFQQGLRELLDSERQDLSDMAQAVLTEGITDAILGAATFGIGLAAGKGLKMIFGRTTKELAEEGAEQAGKYLVKEAGEEGAERVTSKEVRDLVARGISPHPSKELKKYATATAGRDLVGDIMQKFGIPKSGATLKEAGEKGLKESGEKLTGLLAGKTAKTADVIEELSNIQYKALTPGGEFKAGMESATKMIDDYIKEIASYGDSIPLEELNKIKQRMQKAFPVGSGVTKSATKLVEQEASTTVKTFIEKFHPEIAGTNREKMLSFMASQIGERLDQKKAKALFDFTDLVVAGAGGPLTLLSKKGADMFTGVFKDPLVQAKLLDQGLKMASAQGNKQGVRNIVRFMWRLGVGFGASAITPENVSEEQQMMQQLPQQQPAGMIQPTGQEGALQGMSPEDLVSQPYLTR